MSAAVRSLGERNDALQQVIAKKDGELETVSTLMEKLRFEVTAAEASVQEKVFSFFFLLTFLCLNDFDTCRLSKPSAICLIS